MPAHCAQRLNRRVTFSRLLLVATSVCMSGCTSTQAEEAQVESLRAQVARAEAALTTLAGSSDGEIVAPRTETTTARAAATR